MSADPAKLSPEFPVIETERLVLRPLAPTDLEFVFRHFSDPEVTRYMLDEEPLSDIRQAQELIDFYAQPDGKNYNRWGIARKENGALIGTCGFHKWNRRSARAEIGYDLTPAFWGQGVMTEAVSAMLWNGFGRMGLNRVEAIVYPENIASVRLLTHLGFSREGVMREYYRLGGRFYDHALFSLLRREWEEQ
jgi:ribosomal-protein-alanine N-acetyltransferase